MILIGLKRGLVFHLDHLSIVLLIITITWSFTITHNNKLFNQWI